ncbi:hypothetical protein HYN59_08560 [Flavobacterium album]|uniref:Uncharacterized protein n=1 Tax=Flavobacterium album TaxID=2175091 RepID=A0A2S1QY46_9FLAO|nr:hypothetical protein [Flavobacterium album]AWH85171.1 hypothetical protein HYN59_08560 [Flavobacterium album]
MKKTILSLSALFAVAVASAQSYPKQPDKTVVEYVSYQKPVQAEVKEQPVDAKTDVQQAQPGTAKNEKTSQEVKSTTVAVNDEKSAAKKSQ